MPSRKTAPFLTGTGPAGFRAYQDASNQVLKLPQNVKGYPAAIAEAVSQLRLAGVNGPRARVPGAKQYTAVSGGSGELHPLLRHVRHVVDGKIVWAPSIDGGRRGVGAGSVTGEGGATSRLNRT